MSALRLNRALTLESPAKLADGAGGYMQGWEALGQLWADVQATGAQRLDRGGAGLSRVQYIITVRAAPIGSTERPQAGQRFREGSRIFDIRAVQERGADGRYLTCHVHEETAT